METIMRGFFAIELDEKTRQFLIELQNQLGSVGVIGNYSFSENLHLTIKFLGELDAFQCDMAENLLEKVAYHYSPFVLNLNKIGKFDKRSKMIIWVGMEHSECLLDLYRDVKSELDIFWRGNEENHYSPHITLVREAKAERSFSSIEAVNERLNHSFTAKGISLMESTRVNGRLTYIRRAYQPFKNC